MSIHWIFWKCYSCIVNLNNDVLEHPSDEGTTLGAASSQDRPSPVSAECVHATLDQLKGAIIGQKFVSIFIASFSLYTLLMPSPGFPQVALV